MINTLRAKRKMIIGVTAGVIAASGAGYYYMSHNGKQTGMEHAGHQMGGMDNMPVMAMGDTVTLDDKARKLAGVQTAKAVTKELGKEIKTTGKVAMNQSGQTYITSRVEGRIDELYVTAEGEVISEGQPIAAVYSPTYIAAQQEYLLALDSIQKLKGASQNVVEINNRLLDAARRKLQLLNVSADDIDRLEETHQINDHMTMYAQFGGTVLEKLLQPGAYVMPGEKLFSLANLSNVWMYADVYEKDQGSVKPGQVVTVTSDAYPGENFTGTVNFINPILDDATRAAKVRVVMNNLDGRLKPNMFVNASIHIPLGAAIVIPESSLLDTGTRKVVFVAQDENTFVKRDVVIGKEADGYIQILSGLNDGDTVVTAATFLIDSQTKLGSMGGMAGMDMGGK